MAAPVSILLVDDHEVVRRGLREILERVPHWTVVAETADSGEAVALVKQHRPDVVVMDLNLPGMDGIAATRQIKRARKETEVLIFTGSEDEAKMREVFAANARAYILKSDVSEHLVAAITALAQHKSYFTDRVSEAVFAKFLTSDEKGTATPGSQLTPREREVVRLLAEGLSNKEVGSHLEISVKTAETHRATIMRKLQLASFADLVRYAIREGIARA